jgi:hypothetical protein
VAPWWGHHVSFHAYLFLWWVFFIVSLSFVSWVGYFFVSVDHLVGDCRVEGLVCSGSKCVANSFFFNQMGSNTVCGF